jgi:hypothetical protein
MSAKEPADMTLLDEGSYVPLSSFQSLKSPIGDCSKDPILF